MRIICIRGLYWRSVWSLRKDGKDKKPNFRMINYPQLRPLKTKTFIQQHQIQLLSWLCIFFSPQQPNEGYLIISQSNWWVSIYGKEIITQKQNFWKCFFGSVWIWKKKIWINWLKTVHTKMKYVHELGFTIFTNPLLVLISLSFFFFFSFFLGGERHKSWTKRHIYHCF